MIEFESIIQTILIMSLTGSVLAAILFVFKPLIKNRMPKTVGYYLWFIVIAALLIPTSKLLVIPKNDVLPLPSAPIQTVVEQGVAAARDSFDRGYTLIPGTEPDKPAPPELTSADYALSILFYAYSAFGNLYIFGVLAVLLYYIISYSRFTRRMKRHNILSGIDCKVPVYRNHFVSTPMLFGIFHPLIILPDREYADAQLRIILQHELTHFRKKDVLIKWLSLLASAIHWFNPVVWFVRREIDRACELACDEAVIQNLDIDGKRSYGDTLIYVAADTKASHAVLSTTMCEEKKALKERLGAIMKNKKRTRTAIIISAVLVLTAILTVCVIGAGTPLSSFFARKETTYRYSFNIGYHTGERIIEEVLLPDEYEFTGSYTSNGSDSTSRLVDKVFFTYKNTEYYFYYNSRGLEYNNTIYPDIYDTQTDDKVATLLEKPQAMFMLDNYLYYAYGSERRVREYNWHNFYPYYMWYKDYHYARLNLDTMESEDISRTQYEETWDYQEFRNWRSVVTEPVKNLDVFVWLDHDTTIGSGYNGYNGRIYKDGNYDTYFTLKDGDNPKYKRDWYEHSIYRLNDAPTFSVYNAPNLITNKIDEFNRMIAKFPNAETITIYQMSDTDFTEQEMAEIVGKISVPNKQCVKTVMLWSDVLDAETGNTSGKSPKIHNLTDGGKIELASFELSMYQFYTNSKRITVSIPKKDGCGGNFYLYDAENESSPIMEFTLDQNNRTKTFTNLTSAKIYFITASDISGDFIFEISD